MQANALQSNSSSTVRIPVEEGPKLTPEGILNVPILVAARMAEVFASDFPHICPVKGFGNKRAIGAIPIGDDLWVVGSQNNKAEGGAGIVVECKKNYHAKVKGERNIRQVYSPERMLKVNILL